MFDNIIELLKQSKYDEAIAEIEKLKNPVIPDDKKFVIGQNVFVDYGRSNYAAIFKGFVGVLAECNLIAGPESFNQRVLIPLSHVHL